MPSEVSRLQVEAVHFAYGDREVLHDVSITVTRGERVALVGPNGSGKSTLVRLLSGVARPCSGQASIDDTSLRSLRPRTLARRIAVVAQHLTPNLTFTVRQLVSMGRTPHIGLFSAQQQSDLLAVDRAMQDTDTLRLAERRFDELSGGEQQRVMLAVGLAQETDFLLLDEPTVHLDLQHQHDLLRLLMDLNGERNIGIVAVLHDLNLAALFFQRVAILSGGRLVGDGAPAEVVTQDVLQPVFQAPMRVIAHPVTGLPQVLLNPGPTSRAQ